MLQLYYSQIIVTAIILITYYPIKRFIRYIISIFSSKEQRNISRVKTVKRLFNFLLTVIYALIIMAVWGVKGENFFVFLTSVFTVIGVAMFAQWSLLSNITAGILLFFSFPFRIGDFIKIQDKDFPIEAQIIDIKAFCTILQTEEGETISYPNNLLLQKGIVIVHKNL